ncbi:MAG: hypothetical protein AAF352_03650, partial [Pseudomonadota bacterium]
MSDNVIDLASHSLTNPQPVDKADTGDKKGKGKGDDGNTDGPMELPDDCPVVALGLKDNTYYYQDSMGQLRGLTTSFHRQIDMQSLFTTNLAWLSFHFPKWRLNRETKEWEKVKGQFDHQQVTRSLMAACGARGVWDAFEKLRGRGAWCDDDGNLTLHLGDAVWYCLPDGVVVKKPGFHDYMYSSGKALPRPAKTANIRAGQGLRDLFRQWNWANDTIDPVLLLGWVGSAFVGGALDWRSMVWITGDKATGKSTLQRVLKILFGPYLLAVDDTTAAGLQQMNGQDTLPVALDEQEPDADQRKSQEIVKMARLAA